MGMGMVVADVSKSKTSSKVALQQAMQQEKNCLPLELNISKLSKPA